MKRPQSYVRVAVAALAIALSLPTFAASETCSQAVDINKADAKQLICLKGIGPKMADAIVAQRAKNGPFKSEKDLALVPGVGEKRAAKLASEFTPALTGGETK